MKNKQSPVEELLEKADQVIAEQKPQAEVYIAMAESMGQAWNDINSYLMLRKHILHLNVTYHRYEYKISLLRTKKAKNQSRKSRDCQFFLFFPLSNFEFIILSYYTQIKKIN